VVAALEPEILKPERLQVVSSASCSHAKVQWDQEPFVHSLSVREIDFALTQQCMGNHSADRSGQVARSVLKRSRSSCCPRMLYRPTCRLYAAGGKIYRGGILSRKHTTSNLLYLSQRVHFLITFPALKLPSTRSRWQNLSMPSLWVLACKFSRIIGKALVADYALLLRPMSSKVLASTPCTP